MPGRPSVPAGPDGLGDHDLAAWERILPEYATLQRSVEGAAVRRRDGGRRRPGRATRNGWPRSWTGCSTTIGSGAGSTPDERAAADGRASAAACRRGRHPRRRSRGWTRPASPHTIQHDDFHGGNIVVGPDGDRFFDWGDAVIAHPFATLDVTFNSIAHRTGRDLGDPAFDRLRDAYLEAWTDVAPRDVLRRRRRRWRRDSRLHRTSAGLGARAPGPEPLTRWTVTATPSPAGWSNSTSVSGRGRSAGRPAARRLPDRRPSSCPDAPRKPPNDRDRPRTGPRPVHRALDWTGAEPPDAAPRQLRPALRRQRPPSGGHQWARPPLCAAQPLANDEEADR